MRAIWFGLIAATAAGAGAQQQREPRADASFVSYATSACYGTCPVYSVTVYADGRGAFHGERFTAVAGDRIFRVTPAQYADFRRRLERFRLRGVSCRSSATDLPTISLRWHDRGGDARRNIDLGCDTRANAAAFAALRKAPDALPIAALIGKR